MVQDNKSEKRRKAIIKIILAVDFLIVLILVAFVTYFNNALNNFEKRTYEQIFSDKELLDHYGIGTKRNPKDYGFIYSDVKFHSAKDNLLLHAWYAPAQNKESKKLIFFVHGRQATRLKPMKYLSMVRDFGLQKDHAVFLPDLRNSGISPDASTGLGSKFAEDISGAIKFLHETYKTREILFYSFSMGAMATMYFLAHPDLQAYIKQQEIVISKIVLDSPMANARANVELQGLKDGIPGFLLGLGFASYDFLNDFSLDHLRMSHSMPRINAPVLILQGGKDLYTPRSILDKELKQISKKNLEVHFFPEAKHVTLWTNPKYKENYTNIVRNFLLAK